MKHLRREANGAVFYYEKCVGEVLADVDGYFKWWPTDNRGYLDEGFLQAMVDLLKSLNAEWDAQVQKDLAP